MKLRVSTALPVLAAAAAAGLLSASAISAGGGDVVEETQPPAPATLDVREPLLVPDVRRQPYVFAKGILEDAGFAWKVNGAVGGYAGNLVAEQRPAPGTLVVDTGRPLIVLRLKPNKGYKQRGIPKNAAPYAGTKVVVWNDQESSADAGPIGEIPPAEPVASAAEPAQADAPAQASEPPAAAPDAAGGERQPDFLVPGAPAEPAGEMPLAKRALRLQKKLAGEPRQTPALVDHWLYQHNWIVTGALYGWSGGQQALLTLIEIDQDLQVRWGIGSKSEQVARDALAEVRKRSR